MDRWFTGTGDDGYTGLLGPERVPKYDPRPEAYGTVDEAQAALGLVRTSGCARRTEEIALAVQRGLYALMSELAAAGDPDSPLSGRIGSENVTQLEGWIGEVELKVEMPHGFVVPGDSPAGAALHLARTIVRRGERAVARLVHAGLLPNAEVLHYLNRLSSLLFVLACYEDQAVAEKPSGPARSNSAATPIPLPGGVEQGGTR